MSNVSTELPALLNKDFPYVSVMKAVSYPEGVTIVDDYEGVDVLDEEFNYINMALTPN